MRREVGLTHYLRSALSPNSRSTFATPRVTEQSSDCCLGRGRSTTLRDDFRDEVVDRLTRQEENADRARSHAELLAHSQSPVMAGRGLSFLMTGILTDTDHLLETLKHVV